MITELKRVSVVFAALLLAACSSEPQKKSAEAERQPAAEAPKSGTPATTPTGPSTYTVNMVTSKGPVIITVHRDWAPLGAQRFYELVKAGYYDGARFFRVLPNFVAQFGLAANPAVTKKWDKAIKDDAVTHTNKRGSLSFATMGPETRTTQVFINLASNQSLDTQGFAPFAEVTEGMDVVDKFYKGYGEAPDQEKITNQGNAYLAGKFPNLDYIKKATIKE
jgi:peptidyl-prolyl cis-trans isomerase A (cyclophilin A)